MRLISAAVMGVLTLALGGAEALAEAEAEDFAVDTGGGLDDRS